MLGSKIISTWNTFFRGGPLFKQHVPPSIKVVEQNIAGHFLKFWFYTRQAFYSYTR